MILFKIFGCAFSLGLFIFLVRHFIMMAFEYKKNVVTITEEPPKVAPVLKVDKYASFPDNEKPLSKSEENDYFSKLKKRDVEFKFQLSYDYTERCARYLVKTDHFNIYIKKYSDNDFHIDYIYFKNDNEILEITNLAGIWWKLLRIELNDMINNRKLLEDIKREQHEKMKQICEEKIARMQTVCNDLIEKIEDNESNPYQQQ